MKNEKSKEQLKILQNKMYEYNNASNITLSQTPKKQLHICVQPHTYTFIKSIYIYDFISI